MQDLTVPVSAGLTQVAYYKGNWERKGKKAKYLMAEAVVTAGAVVEAIT